MGKTWGQLAYVRNIIQVRISPYEQKAFANFGANSWRGFKRDFFNNAPYIVPALTFVYLLTDWGNRENERLSRKNPADYANDE